MNITSFKVATDKSSLILDLNDAGTVTNLYLWTKETYKVEEFKIDLSSKLNGQFSQIINILPEDIGITNFDGVYFIDVVSITDTACAIAAELTRYKECILNKVLAYADCFSCLQVEQPEVLNAQTVLYTIEKAIELNLIQEVLTLVFFLDKVCSNDCNGCGEYKNI